MTAELLMLIGGVAAFLLTLFWVRNRALREKYALQWLGLAFLLLLAGVFPEAVEAAASRLRLSYPAFVLFVALGISYFFAFGVSVAMTRLYGRNVRLMQEMAFLDRRVRELEALTRPAASSGGARGDAAGVQG
jgi:purine-cytosine permease-like protein